jgi:hypothetical protein
MVSRVWRLRSDSWTRGGEVQWKVMGRAIDMHHDQLGGAYGTHDDANPCQTSTDTEYRCFSVAPCQVVN